MKKLIPSMLSISILLVLTVTCKKDDPEPDPDIIIIADDVNVITDQIWNEYIVSVDSSDYSLIFSNDINIRNQLKIGDIIVSSAGEGLLRKVTSVNLESNNIKVSTDQATLTDIIDQGVIEFSVPLTIPQIKSIEYYYTGIRLDTIRLKSTDQTQFNWNINTVLYDHDGQSVTTADQIKLVGNFSCDWTLKVKIDIGLNQGLKEVDFGFESSEELNLELIAGLQYSFEKKVTLATINFSPIIVTVGIVPVIFTPQLKIIAGLDGYANASVTTGIEQSVTFNTGIKYLKDNGWSPYSEFNKSLSFQPPTLNLNAGAEAYLKPELSIKVYAVAGPYANLKLYSKLDADLLKTPWWTLNAGIKMDAGVKVQILDRFLIDYKITDLLHYEELLAQATTSPGTAPAAAFKGSPTHITAGQSVQFTDQSTNSPTSWSWNFGDGGTSTQQNPSHTYNSAGTYTVSLTVANSYDSDVETKTNYITVNSVGSAPVAAFIATPTNIKVGQSVQFTDQSTNSPTSWSWDFGDGGTSTQQNPSHAYNSAGIYTVSLTVTNSYDSNTETKTNYISVTEPGGGENDIIFNPDLTYGTVSDIDGNTYKTIQIGTQTWMAEDLKTFTYNDGTPIPVVFNSSSWAALNTPGCCFYILNEDSAYIQPYGLLYNWYTINMATNGNQNVCPTGWHVATDSEWTTLENYLIANGYNYDGSTSGNKIAKSLASTSGWNSSTKTGAVGNIDYPEKRNSTGFSALASGYRRYGGKFDGIGVYTHWWSFSSDGLFRYMDYDFNYVYRNKADKRNGFSVRCVKD